MQKLFIAALLCATFFSACKQDSKKTDTQSAPLTASPELLGGHWIAMDFCSRANQYGSVLQAMNNAHRPYTYSLTFNPGKPDSVACSNGFETWSLPVKYNADTLELVGAAQGKSIFLLYDSQGEKDLTMFDGTSGSTKLDKFIKSRATTTDGAGAFKMALNHNVLNGIFTPIGKGAPGNVRFTPDGLIQGLKDYDRYELCSGGDCFVAGDVIDIVTFSKAKTENSDKILGYRYSAQNDTLVFYNMLNSKPDEKGAYTVGSAAYKFSRKRVE